MRAWCVVALAALSLSVSARAQSFQVISGAVHATAFALGPGGLLSGNPNPPDALLSPGDSVGKTVSADATAISIFDSLATGSFTTSGGVASTSLGVTGSGVCVGGGGQFQSPAGGSGSFSATVALTSPATLKMSGSVFNTSGVSLSDYASGSAVIKDSMGNTLYSHGLTDISANPTLFLSSGTYTFSVNMQVGAVAGTSGGGTASFSANLPEPVTAALLPLIVAIAARRWRVKA